MKTIKYLFALVMLASIMNSCQKDSIQEEINPLVVAFDGKSVNFNQIEEQYAIPIVFSEKPVEDGSVIIELKPTEMTYGVDFRTIPEATNGQVEVPFKKDSDKVELTYVNLIPPASKKRKLDLEIVEIKYKKSLIQGNTIFSFSFEESKGGTIEPEVGGPNEPNQVFIDFSSGTQQSVKRDSWTLGFDNGNEFRVVLNETIFTMAGAIEATDIDAVSSDDFENLKADFKVNIGGGYTYPNGKYIDDPDRDFTKNAIGDIFENASENKVFLLDLGSSVPDTQPKVGTAAVKGEPIGERKIRIIRKDNGYLLQYANLNDTSHHTCPKVFRKR